MNQLNEVINSQAQFLENELYLKIIQLGITLIGFGDVSCGLAKEFRHIPRAISLAIHHPTGRLSIIKKGGVEAYNNQFPEIDNKLKEVQKRIVTYLRLHGWKALAIPPDSDQQDYSFISRLFPLFQHKTAATCSGLGWIGKNGLLVTKRYGARLSWATVLTNAPLQVAARPYLEGYCGECSRCVAGCPVGAVNGEEWTRGTCLEAKIDVKACAGQLEKNFQVIDKYICGLCIMACPLGREE